MALIDFLFSNLIEKKERKPGREEQRKEGRKEEKEDNEEGRKF